MNNNVFLFDWGDTLMVDFKDSPGKMCDWDYVAACPNALSTLHQLSKHSDIYIATAASQSSPDDIKCAFDRVELGQYIKGYYCKQNTGFTKPESQFYKTILKDLCILPQQITMVGDHLKNDIVPCRLLGFNTVWICNSTQPLDIPDGVKTIKDLSELLE